MKGITPVNKPTPSSMSVLVIVGSQCMLAMSHATPWWVTVSMPTGQTDRWMDARPLHYSFS